MQRVKRSTAVPALPAPPAGGTPGFFTGGDPQTSQAATVPGYEWFNAVQEELAYVIEQAGLVMSSADNTQLRQAILKMIQDAGKAVVIQNATFEASVANGEAVRWDAGNGRFDEAIADGSANNQAVGFADVTNSKVYCYGETPALFSGLTPGARYYLDATTPGAITTTAPADKIPVGIAKSATTLFVDIDVVPAAQVVALKDDTRNLVIKNNPANIGGSLIITADEVILKDGSGNPLVAFNVALNDLQYIATNMDDGGAPPTNAWTYVWLFSNGSNVVGKYSASPTAPTVPNGYSYKALLAPWRVDGASLHRMRVHDREVSQYDVVFSGQAGPGGALTAQGLASFVPPMAKMVRLALGLSTDGATRWMQVRDTSVDAEFVALVNKSQYHPGIVGNVDGWYEFQETWLPLTVAQTVYWRSESTEAFYRMGVLGYRF